MLEKKPESFNTNSKGEKSSRCSKCGKPIKKALSYCLDCTIDIEIKELEKQIEY